MKTYFYNPILKKTGIGYWIDIYMYSHRKGAKVINTITGSDYRKVLEKAQKFVNFMKENK